jgi:hypothetical protein
MAMDRTKLSWYLAHKLVLQWGPMGVHMLSLEFSCLQRKIFPGEVLAVGLAPGRMSDRL